LTFIRKIEAFAGEFNMLPESGIIVACVSGGADSMCLLGALLELSLKRGFTVCAAHYNHKLRGGESDRDEAFVEAYCAAGGISFFSDSCDVAAYAKDHSLGVEEAAREMRYGFFQDVAEKTCASRIATAHTADDNAETMILNLARGAGAAGLSGIPPVRGIIVRPLLCVSRDEVCRFLETHSIPYVEDSSNSLDIFARNRIRHAVIPVIREINPRFSEAVSATAAILRADEEYLSELADAALERRRGSPGATADAAPERRRGSPGAPADAALERRGGSPGAPADDPDLVDPRQDAYFPCAELLELPLSVSSRVIRKLYGGNLSYNHVKAVLELCKAGNPSARVSLPGATVHREYGAIVLERAEENSGAGIEPIYLKHGDCITVPGSRLKITCKLVVYSDRINKSFTSFLFKNDEICGKMSVRSRREGDIIRLPGQRGTKTLKKLFIEKRVPARKRAFVPVIADDCGVLAVYGIGAGSRAAPEPGDQATLIYFTSEGGLSR